MTGPLVLWDVDYTLINAADAGWRLYEMAFTRMFGGAPPAPVALAGRTDRAIAIDVLTQAGIPEPRRQADAFQRLLGELAPGMAGMIAEQGRVMPGASEALRALSSRAVQSVLTGNLRLLAEVKLRSLGLASRLRLDIGAYGDRHEVRADLVAVARGHAARELGAEFSGTGTVLVGDTPLDVEAALAGGARAVGVASGHSSEAELAAAGAHAVLPDLTDTARVLAAILGTDGR